MSSIPFIVMAGPCVIESEALLEEIAASLQEQLGSFLKQGKIEFYFKASFDKANRTSGKGFRGPGMEAGLKLLRQIRDRYGFSVMTDLHHPEQAEPVAQSVDLLQIPAFLCRQTDLVLAAAEAAWKYGRRLNLKKGQFLAPWDLANVVRKAESVIPAGSEPSRKDWLCLTERGVSFGYQTLVVDMISFQCLQKEGYPVIYDATHSLQKPGAAGTSSGGQKEFLETLARAAVAAGAGGVFLECHPRPSQALSDASTSFPLPWVGAFIEQLLQIHQLVRTLPKLLPQDA